MHPSHNIGSSTAHHKRQQTGGNYTVHSTSSEDRQVDVASMGGGGANIDTTVNNTVNDKTMNASVYQVQPARSRQAVIRNTNGEAQGKANHVLELPYSFATTNMCVDPDTLHWMLVNYVVCCERVKDFHAATLGQSRIIEL